MITGGTGNDLPVCVQGEIATEDCACWMGDGYFSKVRNTYSCGPTLGEECVNNCVDGYSCVIAEGDDTERCVASLGSDCLLSSGARLQCTSGKYCPTEAVDDSPFPRCSYCGGSCEGCLTEPDHCYECSDLHPNKEQIQGVKEVLYKCTKDAFPVGLVIGVFVGILAVLGLVGGLIAFCVCRSKKAAKMAKGMNQDTVIIPANA